jgi:hypothetical protein
LVVACAAGIIRLRGGLLAAAPAPRLRRASPRRNVNLVMH